MQPRTKHVPKHRAIRAAYGPKVVKSAMFSGIALAATGATLVGGVALTGQPAAEAGVISANTSDGSSHPTTAAGPDLVTDRAIQTSRSARRSPLEMTGAAAQSAAQRQAARAQARTSSDPRQIAREMLPEFGFSSSEFSCLDALYVSESDWNPKAENPTSSAYGIPQALTSAHELPADYMTNPATQIRWGLGYIRDSYGTPCAAWNFKQGNGWY